MTRKPLALALALASHQHEGGVRKGMDDYGTFGGCKAAIDEYRAKHKITAPLHYIREDPTLNTRLFGYAQKDQRKDVFEAVWWQKE